MEEIELTAVQKKMEEFIRRERLLEMGDRVVLGVSGGADSVCMMELFAAIREGIGILFRAMSNQKFRLHRLFIKSSAWSS